MDNLFYVSQECKSAMVECYRTVRQNPETSYEEYKTDKYLKEKFEEMGYTVTGFSDMTGFWAVYDTGREGKTLGIFAELDSVINPSHPECDKETGAVHACGHDFQCANVLGVAKALKEGVLRDISGKIKFMIVPAEEGNKLSIRRALLDSGKIKFPAGKQEFIRRGVLDEVDLAFMIHIECAKDGIYLKKGENGLIRKMVSFEGRSAHAGSNPEDGINALYSANLALSAINNLRETFREDDHTRVHPIITKGGDIVNTIPCDVKLEAYVRGATNSAIKTVNDKVNRAIAGACVSMGANAVVYDMPGSLPVNNSPTLNEVFCKVSREILGEDKTFYADSWGTASTDMGDITNIIPAVHVHIGGAEGSLHGESYSLPCYEKVLTEACAVELGVVKELMSDGCKKAIEVCQDKVSFSSIQAYMEFLESLNLNKKLVTYHEDGKIEINLK